MKREKKDLFNPAFGELSKRLKRVQPKAEEPPPEIARQEEKAPDQDTFLSAMDGVTPMAQEREKAARFTVARARPSHPPPDERREAVAHLYGLLSGSVEMDITFSDEYLEGAVKGLSRKTMKRLKRGELPVQDHIDLHGLTRQEAEAAVKDFVYQSFKNGMRCVLIVHGRGLNSPDSFPVLKEGLPNWLGRGKTGKLVLAFSTARPYDGGTGATYVLLRNR